MNHVIFFDHMKKATILFSVLFNAMLLIGQVKDSYELENFSIMSPIQSQITEAKGWSMQDNGKWAYGDNVIPYTDSRTNTSRQDDVESVGIDNFTSIELRKIMIDDKQYNVLVKKYKDGEYEFPLILQGWTNYLSLVFTDTSTVAVYWKEFSLSLVDALPIVSVGLVFALLLVLLTSLRFSIQDYKLIKSYEF